jgi:hypothetical protein
MGAQRDQIGRWGCGRPLRLTTILTTTHANTPDT